MQKVSAEQEGISSSLHAVGTRMRNNELTAWKRPQKLGTGVRVRIAEHQKKFPRKEME